MEEWDNLANLISEPICLCDCGAHWSRYSVTRAREEYKGRGFDKNSKLIYLKGMAQACYENEKFHYRVLTRNVCKTAWEAFWQISSYIRRKIETAVKTNQPISTIHGNSLLDHKSHQSDLVHAFLQNYLQYCEYQPDLQQYHTIARIQKYVLYEEMVAEMKAAGRKSSTMPSAVTFYRVWRKDFKHLKIPKECRLG